ncbi:Cellulose synthase [Arabidopsis thaliana x Arabidopsis arenosa]|uniref:Cellulose synthase n=1 Tax=Arabidopsis thaliana x Arabidopsis arenosa TaxID=1240361 RepID=A0A8T1YBM6_9BRAS|nr:Cellulose synthase [Arabidopsis thaliana x Arabidopsis arenosa]
MADSSSSLHPLSERISHKSYVLRAVDLTMLGLLYSLLLYRILHISQNDNVWLMAFFCESCFSFVWLIFTCIKWSPAEDMPYINRLDERVHDLPSVDMFVPTADPVREPPIIIVNTVLSMLSVNYPANKLACYVSDDGCSSLTYFSLKEASKFAMIWVPFCKKYNVRVRAPFRYFLNPLVSTDDSAFRKDWEMTKREYEKLCRKVEDATGDSHWLDADDDFKAFSNTKPNDHSTIVKVVWENKGGVGDDKEVPHLVYISREKRPKYLHHYKTGAMNFLLRVSGLMTNAPYMLNVDCDMYVNEPDYLGRGVAGIQGPFYIGSGCFHTRRVMYGLSSDDIEDNGNLSSVATREFLAEDTLVKRYGSSKELVKSVVDALQRKSNPQKSLENLIEAAQQVGHCHYEYQTSWGNFGWLYDSVAEDINTSIGIHLRGWTSSFISPDPPSFVGSTPSLGLEAIVQQRRWSTGAIEVLFNKQSPLIGMFRRKIKFRQRLAYFWALMCIRSIPELVYCLLPAYCLLHNSALFPKGPCLGIIVTLLGMHCLYSLWQFMRLGFSVKSWVHDFPSVDMFVPTADPVREPPIIVVNTVLSLLAVNYPTNKLACYVSDDGCSPLTYFSLTEASKFAKIWVPFCKKYNVRVRAPFRYFLNPLVATDDSVFSKDWKMTKREYEKLCRKIEDATGDSHWLDADEDFEAFSNTKPNDHSTIVKVVWENKGGVGDDKEVPHLVYISREKRPNYLHHYKTGAMNFLLRVSGLMTNAPYMLNVDCDMYANEPDVVRQAMCVFLENSKNSNHCAFVQFPQEFYDSYTNEFTVLQSYLGRGVAGIQGPIYCGSGCFLMRHAVTDVAFGTMVRSVLGTDRAFKSRSVAGRRGRLTMSSSNRLNSKEMVFEGGSDNR